MRMAPANLVPPRDHAPRPTQCGKLEAPRTRWRVVLQFLPAKTRRRRSYTSIRVAP